MESPGLPSDSGLSSNRSATNAGTPSFAQVHDNVASSHRVPPPPQPILREVRLDTERLLGSSAPAAKQLRNFSLNSNSSGRSSQSNQHKSSGYTKYSTTPFDSFIFDETDNISCYLTNGYLLLVTNVWDSQHPEPRYGTTEDSDEVERFFKRAGFTIKKLLNKSKKQMKKEFENLRQSTELCAYDSFVLVIMSHGSEEGVHGNCGKPYNVDKIVDLFKGDSCPALLTKPKLFFIQACRGGKVDEGCKIDDSIQKDCTPEKIEPPTIRVPTDSDIFVAYSTTEGRLAHRYVDWSKGRPTGGSWFISCMMQVFNAYGDREDLMTMMVRVNRALSKYGDESKQIPCQLSMLTKKVYFILEQL